ncbi:MAG: transglutaminase family protein [Clostridia bacterium]|nr:transglutaminase family protein [Clostridia bacterium]
MRLPLESLMYDLPEDILKTKLSGDLKGALQLINHRLNKENISSMMRERLLVERHLIEMLPKRFPYNRQQALEIMKARVRDFTEEEFDKMELDGCMDFYYIDGEKRYVRSFAGTLVRMDQNLWDRQYEDDEKEENLRLKDALNEMREKGELAYRYKIKKTLKIDDDKFIPGETYLCHLPIPAKSAQQAEDKIIIEADADGFITPANEHHRTVSYKRTLEKNEAFSVTFTFENRVKYVRPFEDKPFIAYENVPAPTEDDLSELLPHIAFTPYLKKLAKEIAGDETDKLKLARKVYDYVTMNVRYSFMRSYILVERHAEYPALNHKGDCGIQAILLITLLRILGIPARWQSGLTTDPKSTGNHDWAQFYTEEFGWLFADPSFGGSAYRSGNKEKWDFYFGNLDPFRMIANDRYFTRLNPEKKFERYDPYDNQDGEIECGLRGFDSYEYDSDSETMLFEKID